MDYEYAHIGHGERGKGGEQLMYRCACLVPLILWFELLSRFASERHFLEKQGKATEPETNLMVEDVSFKGKEQKGIGKS